MNENILFILGENKKLTLFCACLFVGGVVAGLLSYSIFEDDVPKIMEDAFRGVMEGKSKPEITLKVISRNTQATLITLVSGVTVIIPPAIITLNGVLTGLVVRFAQQNKGLTLIKIMGGILPHGVFELPAFFITAAVGMKIGLELFFPGREGRIKAVSSKIKEALIIYLMVVIPLIIVSAVIEVFISTSLVKP